MATRLTETERAEALAGLPHWQTTAGRDAIRRVFEFRSFAEAFAFMTRAALLAEKMNHHPEWSNVYRTVDVTLSTHDAEGLTELDIRFARALDRFTAEADH